MENNKKTGFVSIIGPANAGKSTLLNKILKENIAITSKKPQTTRRNMKGIYNDSESQIVFVDTPGIHMKKNKLDEYMDTEIEDAIKAIDLIIYMVDIIDATNKGIEEYTDLKKLKQYKSSIILVLNKIDVDNENVDIDKLENDIKDIIKKEKIDNIKEIFVISALRNKNIKELIELIKKYLDYGPLYYDEDELTDTPTKIIIADIIREHCLYKLHDEIPHGINVEVTSMKKSKAGTMMIDANVIVERVSHKAIVIGKGAKQIKDIGVGSRIAIEKFLGKRVNLNLSVKVKENWRSDVNLLEAYGFKKNK